jgi:hypothetical protein
VILCLTASGFQGGKYEREKGEETEEAAKGRKKTRLGAKRSPASVFEKKRLGGVAMGKGLQKWVEFYAMVFVWIFGMLTAILTVVGTLPVLSKGTSLTLLISLIVFLVAATIVFVFEALRKWDKSKR